MFEILTLNKIAKCGLAELDSSKYTITDDASRDADGIILRSFKMHDMELLPALKGVARAGAGTNNIPIDKCTEKGIVVFNTPGANANAVKELVLLGLFMAARKVTDGISWASGLTGDDVGAQVEKGKSNFAGNEIKGKTLGVIGLGAIGGLVANAAVALGMKVIGYDPYLSVNAAWKLDSSVEKADSCEEIYEKADYLTLHIPLTGDNKGFINAEKLSMMKDGVKILNFSRGELVANADIKSALESGKVSAYVVDFPSAETVNVPGIVAIPHLGASTAESEDNCAVMAAEELSDFLENGNITNSVNFPNCTLPVSGVGRVAVAHKNTANMIGQFTSVLGKADINISDMINKSRNDIAYTIINTDHSITDEVVEKLASIDGVLRVRAIR